MEDRKEYQMTVLTGNYQDASIEQKQMLQELFGENAYYVHEWF